MSKGKNAKKVTKKAPQKTLKKKKAVKREKKNESSKPITLDRRFN